MYTFFVYVYLICLRIPYLFMYTLFVYVSLFYHKMIESVYLSAQDFKSETMERGGRSRDWPTDRKDGRKSPAVKCMKYPCRP